MLVCLLCLSMASCKRWNKYAELNEMLDEGEYSEAITYILKLQNKESSGMLMGVVSTSTDDVTSEEMEALLPLVLHTWTCSDETSEKPKSITLQENGICHIDGATMTWTIEAMQWVDEPHLIVNDGKTDRYLIMFSQRENGEILLCCNEIEESGTIISFSTPAYFCAEKYTTVTLTMDNWQEYFEFTESSSIGRNGFDELTSIYTSYDFTLKPEYAARLSSCLHSEGAVEIQHLNREVYVTVDAANGTYAIGAEKDVYSERSTEVRNFEVSYSDNKFNANYASFSVSQLSDPSKTYTTIPSEQEILRIQGTLYLVNEA